MKIALDEIQCHWFLHNKTRKSHTVGQPTFAVDQNHAADVHSKMPSHLEKSLGCRRFCAKNVAIHGIKKG